MGQYPSTSAVPGAPPGRDADEGALRDAVKELPDWSVHAEQQVPLPDTRKKIE
jgi:hypothetical protein